MNIEKRPLGRTGIHVTPIGLGVMQFSGAGGIFKAMMPDIDQTEKNAIVQAALDGGINWFDTAEMYGLGKSECSLVEALREAGKSDEDVIIGTKWFPLLRTSRSINRTISKRIHFLDGFSIDLHMVHQPISLSSPEEEMEAMAYLVEAGLIRSVGVSNFSADRMRRAHAALAKRGLSLAVNQVEYSLLHREIESNGILETAKELGVTIVCWGPLASGLLSGKFHKDPAVFEHTPFIRRRRLRPRLAATQPLVDALDEIGQTHGATAAQVALNWLIHFNGEIVVAIPGASKISQATEAAEAMGFRLSDEEISRLDQVSRSIALG
jgi:aryl-alcohol dehydrogenase-like predicted oxidoreductase